jgi:hypothetical protein
LLVVKVRMAEVPPPGAGLKTVTLAVPADAISATVMAAVTWEGETKVVVRFAPFHLTTLVEVKLAPFTVRVKAEPPAVVEVGERVVVEGTGLLMVKVWLPEVPPPGAGLKTVTLAVPADVISAAVIAALTWEEETKVVVRLAPFHFTTLVEVKLPPLIVRVKAEPPAIAEDGERLVVDGTRLLIVNVWLFEVPPPGAGLKTDTFAVPADAISATVMAAVTWDAETNDVVRFAPFHLTTLVEVKLAPFTVRVKAGPPAIVEDGERLVVNGTLLLMVKVRLAEVPPPGEGLKTETFAVPADTMSAAVMDAVTWEDET